MSFYLAVLMLCFGCGCRIYDGLKPGLRTAVSVMGKIQEWTVLHKILDLIFFILGEGKKVHKKTYVLQETYKYFSKVLLQGK